MAKARTKKIKFRRSLFWDVNPAKIDQKKNARYIIERILDFGNTDEVKWLWNKYPVAQIKDVVKTSRALHPKSRALWSLMLR